MFGSLSRAITIASILASLLTACGGGGGSYSATPTPTSTSVTTTTTPPPNQNPDPIVVNTVISSVFDGKNDLDQPVTTLLQDDGSFFMVYSDAATGGVLGASIGQGNLASGNFSSADAFDISLTGTGTQTFNPVTLSASYTSKQTLNGTITFNAGNQARSFTTNYNGAYETLPTFVSVAGTYKGTIATKDLREQDVELTISANGTLSGKISCGCTVNAALTSHIGGIAYDATLTFTGGSHALTGTSMGGNVYFDIAGKRMYIVGTFIASGDKAIFVGAKK